MRFLIKTLLIGIFAFGIGLGTSSLIGVQAAPLNNVAPTPENSGVMGGGSMPTAPDGNLHVFFLRKSPNSGVQPNVKTSVYLPGNITNADWDAMRIRVMPSGNPALQETSVCDVPATTRVSVTVTVKAGAETNFPSSTSTWTNSAICQSGNFFSAFPLPTKPASTASQTAGYWEVVFKVNFTSTAQQASIRFYLKVTGPRGGATKIGQQGGLDGNNELLTNFPILGALENRYEPGSTFIKIPFGSCRSLANSPIGVYDAENGIPGFGNNRLFFKVWKSGFGYVPLSINNFASGSKFSNGSHGPLNDPTRFYPANASNSATSNAVLAQAYFQLDAEVPYRLEIYGLDPRNTIDVAVPGDTIHGELGCSSTCFELSSTCPGPTPLKDKEVSITGSIYSSGDTEVGLAAAFGGAVEVSGYPEPEVGGWGYNEIARRQALNMQIVPDQKSYDAQQGNEDPNATAAVIKKRLCHDGQQRWTGNCNDLGTYICAGGNANDTCGNYRWRCRTSSNTNFFFTSPSTTNAGISPKPASCVDTYRILCADGQYRGAGNCTDLGTWRCQDGVNRDACGNYYWSCDWTSPSGAVKTNVVGWQPSAPACRIFQYQCRDTAGNWTNDVFKDYNANETTADNNFCTNKYDCPAPAPSWRVSFDPNYGASFCRIFRCAYDTNGDQRFYWEPGDNPDDQCDIRCNGGAGGFAPKHDEGDENCYVQPYFRLSCIWTPNDGQPAYTETQIVDGNRTNYCQHPVGAFNVNTASVSLKACLSLSAFSVTGNNFTDITGNNWLPAGIQPGHGLFDWGEGNGGPTGLQPFKYRNWTIVRDDTQECVDVYGAPYFKVFGSDARVGGGIAASGVCQTNTGSQILAHNRGPTGAYQGAGTQYAAIATGSISGFASGLYNGNNANPSANGGGFAAPGTALSFANTGVASPYGGSFGPTGVPGCVNYVPSGMTATNYTGTVTLPALTPGQITTQYFKGDVFIGSNFEFNFGAGLAGLMSYRLVVDGNIYIGKNVTRLDGTFVALNQSDPNKGIIYDCADAIGSVETHTLSGCENQLVINGSMAARSVRLLRDCGSLKDAAGDNAYAGIGVSQNNVAQCRVGNNAAEVFNYSPELWLVPLNNPGYSGGADSIRSMPPIL